MSPLRPSEMRKAWESSVGKVNLATKKCVRLRMGIMGERNAFRAHACSYKVCASTKAT
jgi:hypothetical protein